MKNLLEKFKSKIKGIKPRKKSPEEIKNEIKERQSRRRARAEAKKTPEEIRMEMEIRESRRHARAQARLIKKKNKLDEQKEHKKVLGKSRRIFFNKWSFWGVILILISVIITYYSQKHINIKQVESIFPFITIVSGLFSTIGIALFIGSIFDFSKNSEAFMNLVSDILSDIVVSKGFLSTLSAKDKEQSLNLILRPTGAQVEQYANINNYFQMKIKEAMTMFDVNFKTNVVYNIEAYVENGIVYCKSTLTHSIYKLNNQFQPLEIYFEKDGSKLDDIKVIAPDCKVELTHSPPEPKTICGVDYMTYKFEIPKEYWSYDHLTVKRTVIEPGHDHWINFFWQSLTPCDGITCRIDCADNLIIKEYMIFDNKAYYNVDKSDDHRVMEITSSQWLNAGTGISCVIGLKDSADESEDCTDEPDNNANELKDGTAEKSDNTTGKPAADS